MEIILAGNPNAGKTTLFNALTGEHQRIGNWPGVTVEEKKGHFLVEGQKVAITDLPGTYSLALLSEEASQDEKIAAHHILYSPATLIINVVDASCLERHLYLTSQLLELGKPVIVVLTMMDIARSRGIVIDIPLLEKTLQCPVTAIDIKDKKSINPLLQKMKGTLSTALPLPLLLPSDVEKEVLALQSSLAELSTIPASLIRYYAFRMLEGDIRLGKEVSLPLIKDIDIQVVDARYASIHEIIASVQKKRSDASEHLTAKLDKIVLHPYLGIPLFLSMMYCLFFFAIHVGGIFQDFFAISTETLFVQGSAWCLQELHAPLWMIALIAEGVGKGLSTTLTFVPVMAAMFFFLALLESSGYMARAAFVVDRIMRKMGLPGKSFVPFIIGFGCNVPAIMAGRTLETERDKFLTIVMSPFMSCSARLAIYAVFVGAFFPKEGASIVFFLYSIGVLMAVLTGWLLRKTRWKGEVSPLILELPAYHKPSFLRLLKETKFRLRIFIVRASRMIIPVCVVLGGLHELTLHGQEGEAQSVLSSFGKWITPLFQPLGLTPENWPATVGLLTGMLAKEVVIGTLQSLYAKLGHVALLQAGGFHFWESMQEALFSIVSNIRALGHTLLHPFVSSAEDAQISSQVSQIMVTQFQGKIGAFAYLLFVLLYVPCVSTMAAIRQEANAKLMWFSLSWSFLVAYATSVLFYQWAQFSLHPKQTLVWTFLMLSLITSYIAGLYWRTSASRGGLHAATNL